MGGWGSMVTGCGDERMRSSSVKPSLSAGGRGGVRYSTPEPRPVQQTTPANENTKRRSHAHRMGRSSLNLRMQNPLALPQAVRWQDLRLPGAVSDAILLAYTR